MDTYIDSDLKVRKTYAQNWTAYNNAQTHEKSEFLILLYDLCQGIGELPCKATGRRRIPISDAVFSICFKIFSTVSGRRFISDLQEAVAKGYISKALHFNSLFNYLENPELTPLLHDLIFMVSHSQ